VELSISGSTRQSIMIEVHSTPEGVIIVRFRGAVTDREFTELATTIANFGSVVGLLIYFDWLGIGHWALPTSKIDGPTAWRRAGKLIKRAAVVHENRLNRQAAWLGAILRSEGVEVRSWQPSSAAEGAAWLQEGAAA
jgi:hypothetical protein